MSHLENNNLFQIKMGDFNLNSSASLDERAAKVDAENPFISQQS